ncbi:glycerate kinase [Alkalibacillus flavidus]|uniref:Glycerate kinase n=1 Tax=Alkalibacillus flavidus TaxID=546021 RepID=A0ABV2KXQ5_9BACI
MKITIAPDSFKGSLTAEEASQVMANAIRSLDDTVQCVQRPMADGGEGTIDALVYATEGRRLYFDVTGPLGDTITSVVGINGITGEAMIESSSVCGMEQVPESERNPMMTTSYGLGELLLKVLDHGYEQILIGLGGSIVNDGGIGMLNALGARFYDEYGMVLDVYGRDLLSLSSVDLSGLDERLNTCTIRVASDVDNPLTGVKGATYVFGPQKGASELMIQQLDEAMQLYSELVENEIGKSFVYRPGAGAAGGLGFALMVIGGDIKSGAYLIADAVKLEEAIQAGDLVITGEGKSDDQTFYGKAPGYIARLCQNYHTPCLLMAGALDDPDGDLRKLFTDVFSTTDESMPIADQMANASQLLFNQTIDAFKSYLSNQS